MRSPATHFVWPGATRRCFALLGAFPARRDEALQGALGIGGDGRGSGGWMGQLSGCRLLLCARAWLCARRGAALICCARRGAGSGGGWEEDWSRNAGELLLFVLCSVTDRMCPLLLADILKLTYEYPCFRSPSYAECNSKPSAPAGVYSP